VLPFNICLLESLHRDVMTNYRRLRVPGGTYYFSACLADSDSSLLADEVELLRHAVRLCQKQRPFVINAAVVLPAQVQMIWTLPDDDVDYLARWRQIKSTFSRHVPLPVTLHASLRKRGEKGIWQCRFWEHHIRDAEDYALYDHLIATAPLRAGLLRDGGDWPLCSAYKRRMRFNASLVKTTDRAPSTPNPKAAENAIQTVLNYASERC
jgi:putative transposase